MSENNQLPEHWLRVSYGLKCVKKGLQHFVERKTRAHYSELFENVKIRNGSAFAVCRICQINRKCLNGVFKTAKQTPNSFCNNHFCDRFCDEILLNYYPYANSKRLPIWANTDSTKWADQYVGFWEVAKCFLSCPTSSNIERLNTLDTSGLINICLNSTAIRQYISNTKVFEEVREIRNTVFHSATYKLDKKTADDYLEKMIELLNDSKDLQTDCFTIKPRQCLIQVRAGKKTISDIMMMTTSIQSKPEISKNEENDVEVESPEPYNMFESGRMSDERIKFTAKLVKLYPWIKEEMETKTALSLEKILSPKAYSRDPSEVCQWHRRAVVDDFLKRVIFSACTTVHEQFQANLTNVEGGSKIAKKLESCHVSDQEKTEFQIIQQRRTERKFVFSRCVRHLVMSNPSIDSDIIADELLSSYTIGLEEHSNIVHTKNKDTKFNILIETISKCDKSVIYVLKDICTQFNFHCILFEDENVLKRDHEDKTTAETVVSEPKLSWFSRKGFGIKTQNIGSIILTFDCTIAALEKLEQDCKDGEIVQFLDELLSDEPVLKTISKGHHNAHVEIKATDFREITVIISGTIFLEKSRICTKHEKDVPQHDVFICEELEVTPELIAQLRDELAIPVHISLEHFERIERRRGKVHDLLRLCSPSFDFGLESCIS